MKVPITIVHTKCTLCGAEVEELQAFNWKNRVVCEKCAQKLEQVKVIEEVPSKDAYNSLSMSEILRRAAPIVLSGGNVYFEFTCAYCGLRQGFDEPNTYYLFGTCEKCGEISQITRAGFLMTVEIGRVE